MPCGIDNGELFNLTVFEYFFGIIQVCAQRGRDQTGARHDITDRLIIIGDKPQIPIRNNADQTNGIIHNGHTGNMIVLHQGYGFLNTVLGMEVERIHDHTRFRALHFIRFDSLLFNRQVAVQNTYSTLASHGNGQACLCYCVHCCTAKGDVQTNIRRQPA